jgi:hypothetical protein
MVHNNNNNNNNNNVKLTLERTSKMAKIEEIVVHK